MTINIHTSPNVEWRPITGFEGFYEVSNTGLVRSVDRVIMRRSGVFQRSKGVLLKLPIGKRGHCFVNLRRPGVHRTPTVGVLVLEAFVGPRPPGLVCCHYDDNSKNNTLENLRWDTHSANRYDSVRNGTHTVAARTHCKWGHEYTPENTVPRRGNPNARQCLTCLRRTRRQVNARAYAAKRARDLAVKAVSA